MKLCEVSWLKFPLHSSNTTAAVKAAQCASSALGIVVVMCKCKARGAHGLVFSGQGDLFVASLSGKILSVSI